jgi:hypothetical protein
MVGVREPHPLLPLRGMVGSRGAPPEMDLLLLTTSQTIMQCLIMYIYMHCF